MIIEVNRVIKPEDCKDMEQLSLAIRQHQFYVGQVMNIIAERLKYKGLIHDYSKLEDLEEYWEDSRIRNNYDDPMNRDWIKKHTQKERHHINIKIPEKMNLFDIIEFVVDSVVTAKTNEEELLWRIMRLSNSDLQEAYWNTIEYIDDMIELKDD